MELITDTFIKVAPDSKVSTAEIPLPRGGKKTVPLIQYELLIQKPYALTLEELMLATHVAREGLTPAEAKAQSEEIHAKLFSKPYPCMRASVLLRNMDGASTTIPKDALPSTRWIQMSTEIWHRETVA